METDEVTQALRVYEKFYPSHSGAFWREQGRYPSQFKWLEQREGHVALLIFVVRG